MLQVMIVEDNAIYRYAVKSIIQWEDYGFELTTEAINGMQAFNYIQERHYDLVITDISMPEMNGLDLIQQTKQLYPEIKFIALSSFDDFQFVKEAMKLGAEDYLLKHDLETEGLVNTLEQVKSKILKDREKLAKANSQASDLYLSNISLRKLVLGESIPAHKANQALSNIQDKLGRPPYIVHLLHISANKYEEVEADSMLSKARILFLDDIASENEFTYPIALSDQKVVVIQSFLNEKSESRVAQAAHELAGSFILSAKRLQLSVSVGMSQMSMDISDISSLYQQAESNLFQKIYDDQERIFSSHVYQGTSSEEIGIHQSFMVKLSFAFKSEDMSVIEEEVTHIFDMINSSRLEMKHVKRLLFDIFALLPVIAAERKMMLNSMNHWHDVLLDSMENLEPIREIREYFLSCCHQIFGQKDVRQSYRKDIQVARNYIHAHYNEDISVADLSIVLNLSPNYLSKLFRSETGKRIVEYINEYRIEAAKKLLRETNLKVYEVGEKTGFQETSYFCKVFKEMTGVTVSEYRKS